MTYITDEMLIGDILSQYPEAAQIMEDYGLHCTGCSVNAFEPLKMGAMSHGMEEKTADEMISNLNDLAEARAKRVPTDGIYVTERAVLKIKAFAKEEEKEGYALRITAKNNGGMEPEYAMDFEEKAKKTDKTFEFHEVTILLDKESFKNMQGAEVDFLETAQASGFKITNPKFTKGGDCSTGAYGCGDEGCC